MNTLDFPPVSVINENGSSDWLLVCEHAGKAIPADLHDLGLDSQTLDTHIGYDIGAYEMTLALSEQLDATAVIGHYSRLVIDCNRPLSAVDCIPPDSDGIIVPGNQNISAAERQRRITHIYQPFHQAVFQTLMAKLAKNPQTKLGNIHSFTPMLSTEGLPRPWEIGFIYRDPHPTLQLIDYIREHTDYCVGDNQPYNGVTHKGYTVPAFADAQNLPAFLVEFRQDLIADPAGVAHWSTILTDALAAQTQPLTSGAVAAG